VSDLKFPAGIKAVKHGTQNPVVVAVTEPKVEEEAPAADAAAAAPAAPAAKGKGGKPAAAPAKAAEPAKKK
jgi:large subunit ribosomal protein L25